VDPISRGTPRDERDQSLSARFAIASGRFQSGEAVELSDNLHSLIGYCKNIPRAFFDPDFWIASKNDRNTFSLNRGIRKVYCQEVRPIERHAVTDRVLRLMPSYSMSSRISRMIVINSVNDPSENQELVSDNGEVSRMIVGCKFL
jgi:hypothetical protein